MQDRNSDSKIRALKKVYALYDEAVSEIGPGALYCSKGCAACCTCNVTLTSLEARLMEQALSDREKEALCRRITLNIPQKRYRPQMTTNAFVRLIRAGNAVPDEENDPAWGRCPALEKDECTIYDVRPFGCRALISRESCEKLGYASVPPIALTINNLFMQIIEQMDMGGAFGNFSDLVPLVLSGQRLQALTRLSGQTEETSMLLNEKIPVLMVEPEYQKRLAPLIQKVSALL